MESIGYILISLLFIYSAYNHIKNSTQIAGYATSAFGDCPFATQLGYLGGWPTGLYLAITGVLVALGTAAGFYLAAGFLAVATVLYHRDLKDPNTWKNVALAGATLALGALV